MENVEKKQLTFIYSPINYTLLLAVLESENAKIVVNEVKKMLMKSLGMEQVSTSRVPLAKISEDKNYSLLGEFEIIKGVKAMNKFIYAFELSDSPHTFKCILCRKMCDGELKNHVENNCLFIMCNFCTNNYFKDHSMSFICPVCSANVTALSFIQIGGESIPAISMLNVPAVLCGLVTDKTVCVDNLSTKLGESRLFKLTFEDTVDNLSQKGEYTVHFVDEEDHQCTHCYHGKRCLPVSEKITVKEISIRPDHEDKISKGPPPVDKSVFQEKKPTLQPDLFQEPDQSYDLTNNRLFENEFEEAELENVLNQFHQDRNNTLQIFKEKSLKVVKEGLENLTQEFERFSKTFEENRPSRNLDPFKNLKFSGRNDFMHPMRFIEDFEFFATRERLNDYEKQFFFGQSLIEDAANWLKVCGYKTTYEDVKESFLNYFWSEDDQNRFRNFLKHGKYNKDSGLSMFVYFHKYAYEATFLNTVPEEELLTQWLSGHFAIMIQTKMYGNRVKSIIEALRVLKSMETPDKNGNSEAEVPYNFFSSSTSKKTKTGVWEDFVGYKYEGIKKDGELFHRCVTEKIWPLHSLSYNNSVTDIKHFDVYSDEASSRFLNNVPCKIHYIYVDINGTSVDYKVLGPITIAKQNGMQLIVTTCPSFKTYKKLTSGQLLYIRSDDHFKPCSLITCSIPEDSDYRYVIPNRNESIVCLSCKDKIEEIQFRDCRSIAVEDLIVCYFEQSFKKKKHILRFLNETFCTVYTVWDDAVEEYNPLKPTYH